MDLNSLHQLSGYGGRRSGEMQGCRKMLEKWKQGGWEKDGGVSRDRGSFWLSVQFYGVDRVRVFAGRFSVWLLQI